MTTAIAVFHESSFSLEEDGAQARVASMLDRVCAEFEEVTVYSYFNHHTFPWTAQSREKFARRWPSAKLVLEQFTPLLRRASLAKNVLISLFPSHATRIIKLSIPFAATGFRSINNPGTVCFINHKFGLTQLNGVNPDFCFVDTHDLLWLKTARLGNRLTTSLRILRKFRGEVAALNTVRGVIAISPSEANFFKLVLSEVKVFYVPIWEKRLVFDSAISEIADFDLVFVASDYLMNVRGFCNLLEVHGHWLKNYKIAVCGRVCHHPDIIDAGRKHDNITLVGFAEDLERLYHRCKASIAPVNGTGLKIKILSALKYGLPAFASTQAFEGLPHGHEEAVFPITQDAMDAVLGDVIALRRAKLAALDYYASFEQCSESDIVINTARSLTADIGPFMRPAR